MRYLVRFSVVACGIAALLILAASAQQQVKRPPFDVTNYRLDVQLFPDENKLAATADVTFAPLEDTRSVTFELNGSLKIDSIDRVAEPAAEPEPTPTPAVRRGRPAPKPRPTPTPAGPEITFIQDQVGVSDIGPSVRIDLGENITAGTSVTIRFKYSGVLNSPNGGPLLNKRLAYVGENEGYLMYAARWFPFHDYAADLATSDITISLPAGLQLVGYSSQPAAAEAGKTRFFQSKPGLIGNFAYGKYVPQILNFRGYELAFYPKPGSDAQVKNFGETLGEALAFYTKKFGEPEMGKRLIIVQIDDDSLDFYSSIGMLFISDRRFAEPHEVTAERLQREAAYQWWGLTVGLDSFDDAWLSQGLAEYSGYALRESTLTGAKLDALRKEMLEKALTFEQTASLVRAPASLDDQSIAYQYIMYAKGAMVFKLLRDTLGSMQFEEILRTYIAENRGKRASIDDFEKLCTRISGQNMRYFFARWVEGTGVPEFQADYLIIRTRGGKFIARGTVKQNYDNLRLPVEIQLRSEGEHGVKDETLSMDESSADFNIETDGKPLDVVIDPGYKLLRISPELRISAVARRGIELFREGSYAEAQIQLEAALALDRSNSWIYYHLGLLFFEQRNFQLAKENFQAALSGNLSPTWLQVWSEIKLGNSYDAMGDRGRAVSAYERAEALDDNYDNAKLEIKKYLAEPFDPTKQTAEVK